MSARVTIATTCQLIATLIIMSALRPRVSRKADLLAMIPDIDTLANSLATLHFNTI